MRPGSSRRARWAQNLPSRTPPVRCNSLHNSEVIRKPERTKNTSTPRRPPPVHGMPA